MSDQDMSNQVNSGQEQVKLPIYMDYAATTPVDPRVAEKMWKYMTPDGFFGNPASRSHEYGWKANDAVEKAREQVAELIGADPSEVIWTSGATESDNLAIKGVASFYKKKGNHIITCKTEHKAVIDTCRQLEREGFEVTYLEPESDGMIDLKKLEEAITDKTILISIMHVNNELGVIQDIDAIAKLTRPRKIFFHVDAAQSAGKVEIDVSNTDIDLLSLSGHKIYGPKGIGALYVRKKPRVRLEALIHGGGHERGMRSGTLATHQIVGMGEAFRIAKEEMVSDNKRISSFKQKLWAEISQIEEVYLNGNLEKSAPNIINISFNFIEGESLLLSLKNIAVSTGSACTSASLEPSYVLRAIGRPDELAHSSIRFSFGKFTKEEEVDYVISRIKEQVAKLRDLSPLWEMFKEGIDLDSFKWQDHH